MTPAGLGIAALINLVALFGVTRVIFPEPGSPEWEQQQAYREAREASAARKKAERKQGAAAEQAAVTAKAEAAAVRASAASAEAEAIAAQSSPKAQAEAVKAGRAAVEARTAADAAARASSMRSAKRAAADAESAALKAVAFADAAAKQQAGFAGTAAGRQVAASQKAKRDSERAVAAALAAEAVGVRQDEHALPKAAAALKAVESAPAISAEQEAAQQRRQAERDAAEASAQAKRSAAAAVKASEAAAAARNPKAAEKASAEARLHADAAEKAAFLATEKGRAAAAAAAAEKAAAAISEKAAAVAAEKAAARAAKKAAAAAASAAADKAAAGAAAAETAQPVVSTVQQARSDINPGAVAHEVLAKLREGATNAVDAAKQLYAEFPVQVAAGGAALLLFAIIRAVRRRRRAPLSASAIDALVALVKKDVRTPEENRAFEALLLQLSAAPMRRGSVAPIATDEAAWLHRPLLKLGGRRTIGHISRSSTPRGRRSISGLSSPRVSSGGAFARENVSSSAGSPLAGKGSDTPASPTIAEMALTPRAAEATGEWQLIFADPRMRVFRSNEGGLAVQLPALSAPVEAPLIAPPSPQTPPSVA